jgi:ribosomal protein S18 acetylase RimI-like enzyme
VDGIVAARPLTAADARAVDRRPRACAAADYDLRLAAPADDPEIRALLRASAFAGDVRLSLEREPDSALGGSIEGDVHHTVVARHRGTGALAGIASRAVRSAFVNGRVARIGYLGQLRIDERFRRRRALLDAGFALCRRLSSHDGASIHLASVVADNNAAQRLLARRTSEWPTFEPIDTLVSLAIAVNQRLRVRLPTEIQLTCGTTPFVAEIASCVNRHGSRAQFFPCWTSADLSSPSRCRGLAIDDFVVASTAGRVVGCAACWDQRAFKQVVVRGYAPVLGRWRRAINMFSSLTGAPALPEVGAQLPFAYVSHFAVDPEVDANAITIALVDAVCRRARSKGLEYVVLGLPARGTELGAVKRAFRHRAYESVLYVGYWPEGTAAASSLDGRPANPELAIL